MGHFQKMITYSRNGFTNGPLKKHSCVGCAFLLIKQTKPDDEN